MNLETIFHDNHTVTYWSVYNQRWVKNTNYVPDKELAAMGQDERQKVISHLRLQPEDSLI